MEGFSFGALGGLITLLKSVVDMATGAKKNKKELKEVRKELKQAVENETKMAFEIQRLKENAERDKHDAERDRRELILQLKNILLEHGVNPSVVSQLNPRPSSQEKSAD